MLLPRHVQARILFHLGTAASAATVAGCKGAPPVEGPAIAIPSATSHAVPSAAPLAGPSAPPIAAPKAKTVAAGVGAACGKDVECPPPLHCALGGGAAHFSETGTCTRDEPIYEGRPLVVADAPRVAETGRGAGWSDVPVDAVAIGEPARAREIMHLRAAAFEEHASVAAFARTVCELVALGAPADLVAATSAALADEIAHARASFAWLAALGGGAVQPGPLYEATAPLRTGEEGAEALLCDVFRGGCVGETLAAHRAAERALEAPPQMRAFYTQIAEDEARHAALAFRTVRWLASRDDRLRDVVRAEIDAFFETATPATGELLAPLLAVL
jgi:hypothetical protein